MSEPSEDPEITTPAFVYDEAALDGHVSHQVRRLASIGCEVLFAMKCFAVPDALGRMAVRLAGFATSSLNEARLARGVLGVEGSVHFTSPAIRPEEADALTEAADFVSFNSLTQLRRFRGVFDGRARIGLRVNPGVSTVTDPRYDPCRPESRLGCPLDELHGGASGLVEGVLLHTNCEGEDFVPLVRAVQEIERRTTLLDHIQWINLGGGYLLQKCSGWSTLAVAVERLRGTYGLRVWMEPGKSLVSRACQIVASVVDIVKRNGVSTAILDTSVNHMPEVFEYQFEPELEEHRDEGAFKYVLAGSSCLAGDVFGNYCFDEPLTIGSRVTFADAGAYTLVKANMFNGLSLPNIYSRTADRSLVLRKRFTYDDFLSRCGGTQSVVV